MSLNKKTPPYKETIGAQYICFSIPNEDGTFQPVYEEDVEKTEVVKSVQVSENNDASPIYASGRIYGNPSSTQSIEVSVEVVAFVAKTLAKMRADQVNESTGLLKRGAPKVKPYFAYGKVVILSNYNYRYEWFPKCQLTANTDDANTKEDKFSEQNDTLTISCMPFDDEGNISMVIDSSIKIPEGLTEEKFFSKPILSDDDFESVIKSNPTVISE